MPRKLNVMYAENCESSLLKNMFTRFHLCGEMFYNYKYKISFVLSCCCVELCWLVGWLVGTMDWDKPV